ncbi:MAG: hypothetical protein ABJG15_06335, partial [Hyphomonadaceae bacterium]
TVLPALPALVPSSPNPPILKGIESANGLPIKEEFFNTISSEETFAATAPRGCFGKSRRSLRGALTGKMRT